MCETKTPQFCENSWRDHFWHSVLVLDGFLLFIVTALIQPSFLVFLFISIFYKLLLSDNQLQCTSPIITKNSNLPISLRRENGALSLDFRAQVTIMRVNKQLFCTSILQFYNWALLMTISNTICPPKSRSNEPLFLTGLFSSTEVHSLHNVIVIRLVFTPHLQCETCHSKHWTLPHVQQFQCHTPAVSTPYASLHGQVSATPWCPWCQGVFQLPGLVNASWSPGCWQPNDRELQNSQFSCSNIEALQRSPFFTVMPIFIRLKEV